jgi:hypothetical protein
MFSVVKGTTSLLKKLFRIWFLSACSLYPGVFLSPITEANTWVCFPVASACSVCYLDLDLYPSPICTPSQNSSICSNFWFQSLGPLLRFHPHPRCLSWATEEFHFSPDVHNTLSHWSSRPSQGFHSSRPGLMPLRNFPHQHSTLFFLPLN